MRSVHTPIRFFTGLNLLSLLFLASILITASISSAAQSTTPQLSLADLVVGLRSKKVTLPERNKILTDAVKQRGITFSLTPDIEKELSTTGADTQLLSAIRVKSPAVKVVEAPKPVEPAKPVSTPTPPPPDFAFYQRRADENAGKGEFAAAIADYNKAAEMKANDPGIFFGRGKTHFSMKSYELSIADLDRSIELNPKASTAYFLRGAAWEKLGNNAKAMADYSKAAEIDPANEAAKLNFKRLDDEAKKAEAAKAAAVAPPPVAARPESISVGSLTAADAVRMVPPVYAPLAQRSNVEGKVVVEIVLDETGEVVEAKAVSGPQMLRPGAEDAAQKSKFKPAMFDGKPIKGKGSITYNFTLRR